MSAIEIVYEDNHLIIINKPAGVLVQSDKTGDESLLEKIKGYIKQKYNKKGEVYLAMVHRLDRPTAGLVMFCKTSKAAARMSKAFQDKTIEKTYLALVGGHPKMKQARLEDNLLKNAKQNKSYISDNQKAKKAILTYNVLESFDRYSLLEVNLKTGRHHQIRCQLANLGFPIKGDLKYNAPRPNKDGSISLQAWRMSFTHPITKNFLTITVPESSRLKLK